MRGEEVGFSSSEALSRLAEAVAASWGQPAECRPLCGVFGSRWWERVVVRMWIRV